MIQGKLNSSDKVLASNTSVKKLDSARIEHDILRRLTMLPVRTDHARQAAAAVARGGDALNKDEKKLPLAGGG